VGETANGVANGALGPPPPPPPPAGGGGGGGGGPPRQRSRKWRLPPHPDPPPQGGREVFEAVQGPNRTTLPSRGRTGFAPKGASARRHEGDGDAPALVLPIPTPTLPLKGRESLTKGRIVLIKKPYVCKGRHEGMAQAGFVGGSYLVSEDWERLLWCGSEEVFGFPAIGETRGPARVAGRVPANPRRPIPRERRIWSDRRCCAALTGP
jgi:hypothetical protein